MRLRVQTSDGEHIVEQLACPNAGASEQPGSEEARRRAAAWVETVGARGIILRDAIKDTRLRHSLRDVLADD